MERRRSSVDQSSGIYKIEDGSLEQKPNFRLKEMEDLINGKNIELDIDINSSPIIRKNDSVVFHIFY